MHLTLKPFDPVFIGIEGRRIETRYRTARPVNDHLNISFGFEF